MAVKHVAELKLKLGLTTPQQEPTPTTLRTHQFTDQNRGSVSLSFYEPQGEARGGATELRGQAGGKVHLSRTLQKEWAKIDPLGSFSSCPRIPQSGQGGRAALWAALRADPGRPSARLGRPALFFEGRPEAAGPAWRPSGRPSGPQGGPFGRAT